MVTRALIVFWLMGMTLVFALPGLRIEVFVENGVELPRNGVDAIKTQLEKILGDEYDVGARPADYALVFHVLSYELDSKTETKVVFYPDPNGRYVYVPDQGYYPVSDRTRYKKDTESGEFVPSQYGGYVYLSDYVWARREEDRYVWTGGVFYSKKTYERIRAEHLLRAYTTLFDLENARVLDQRYETFMGKDFEELVRSIHFDVSARRFYKEKPAIAFYEDRFTPLYGRVAEAFQEEGRYNVYDRSYLNVLFDEEKFQDLFTSEVSVGSAIAEPSYLVVVKMLNERYEKITKTDYATFPNGINGAYVEKLPVYTGRYYSYDKRSGRYRLDMEHGTFVKVRDAPWVKDKFVEAFGPFGTPRFNDLFVEDVDHHTLFVECLVNVIDGKTGFLLTSKKFSVLEELPVSKRSDRYGSYEAHFAFEVYENAYRELGKAISSFVREYFAIETHVEKVNGRTVVIDAGKNYGVKRGYVFRIVSRGFTQGYVRIDDVDEKEATGRVVRLIDGKSEIEPEMPALEDFDYFPPLWLTLGAGIQLEEDPSVGVFTGLLGRNVYAERVWSVCAEVWWHVESKSRYYGLSIKPVYLRIGHLILEPGVYMTSDEGIEFGLDVEVPMIQSVFYPELIGLFSRLSYGTSGNLKMAIGIDLGW